MTPQSGVIRVLLSAYSASRRAHLEDVITGNRALTLVGSTYSLDALVRPRQQFAPDVVLADMERADSISLARSRDADDDESPLPIVALIDDPQDQWIVRALQVAVKAILRRDAPADDIVSAIVSAFSGLTVLEPEIVESLLRRVRPFTNRDEHAIAEPLTTREAEVLRMLGEGLSNKTIAARLGISEHTVKFHISALLSKMRAATRTEAVTQGIRNGLIVI